MAQKIWLETLGIKLYHSNTKIKSSIAENCLREIFSRLYRHMLINSTSNWISALENIQHGVNSTKRKELLNYTPLEVVNSEAIQLKLKKKFAIQFKQHHLLSEKKRRSQMGLYKGDSVRKIIFTKNIFKKSYLPGFSNEIFTISAVNFNSSPETFTLSDNSNE